MIGDYQTYLKIISWEDFWKICKYGHTVLNNRRLCGKMSNDTANKACMEPDKNTMLRCPVWKELRNFYGNRLWNRIKTMEEHDGELTSRERQSVAKEHNINRQRYRELQERKKEEAFQEAWEL